MNVNPFSYLIEKLKGYVSKSGDTVFGDLTVNAENGTANVDAYTYLKVGNQTPKSSAKHSTGLLRLCGENGKYTDIYAPNSTASRDIVFPNASGTVALENLTDLTITINTNVLHNYSKVSGVRFGNIAIITGFLETKGAVSQNDVLFTFSGITPSKLMYATALKSKGNSGIVVRIEANTNQAVVDDTPTNATANYDFYCFNMVIFGS